MALNNVVIPQKQKQSGGKGGLFGQIAGTAIGGAAGAFIGGPAGAMQGASLGGSIGGAVGNAADPAKLSMAGGNKLQVMENEPGVKLASLVDAQKTMLASPDFTEPQKQELTNTVFAPTIDALRKRMGGPVA